MRSITNKWCNEDTLSTVSSWHNNLDIQGNIVIKALHLTASRKIFKHDNCYLGREMKDLGNMHMYDHKQCVIQNTNTHVQTNARTHYNLYTVAGRAIGNRETTPKSPHKNQILSALQKSTETNQRRAKRRGKLRTLRPGAEVHIIARIPYD